MTRERVLVTGGAGYIFSNFLYWATRNTDYEFVSLDRLDEAGCQERIAAAREGYLDRVKSLWHDLRSPINPRHFDELRRPFKYIIHGAAMSHVDRAIKDPPAAVLDNVLGTCHLLEYVRHHQPETKCLLISTDEVMGPAAPGECFGEYDRFNAENAYAATKLGGEALAPAYAHQYGLNISVSRGANTFSGPLPQYAEKFIPLCVDKIRRGETVQIHSREGVPSSRLYIHVFDVAAGIMTILERGSCIADDKTGRYHIAPTEEWSNLEIAQRIAALLGKPLRHEMVERPSGRPKPDMRYAIDSSRLRALGWSPKIGLDEGLRQVVLGEAIVVAA